MRVRCLNSYQYKNAACRDPKNNLASHFRSIYPGGLKKVRYLPKNKYLISITVMLVDCIVSCAQVM